ncbi:urease accessory protein UreF [Bacillus sp. FSL M7-0996]|uniref:urease accessory protein UreF n=1 Tax=Bacillus sp. FSL M7-0996 TaxID=2921538 RepID=UPI0030F8DB4C
MLHTNIFNLLNLLQISDSNFPTGSFSHSFGLETFIQEGQVTNKGEFFKWINRYVKVQLTHMDGLICKYTYEATKNNDGKQITFLDDLITAQTLPFECRRANRMISKSTSKLLCELFSFANLNIYKEDVMGNKLQGHPSIVYGILGAELKMTIEETLLVFLYSSVGSIIQNGVRAIPLGQTDGQKLLQECHELICESIDRIQILSLENFGLNDPEFEINQMQHEDVNVRVFMS